MKISLSFRRSQAGFTVVESLVGIVCLGAIIGVGLFVAGKVRSTDVRPGDGGKGAKAQSQNSNEPDLQIYNFGITSLDSIEISTDATKDFASSKRKGLYVFGDQLPGTPVRYNPNFEFSSLKENTTLVSAIDGVVGFIKEQKESGDYEVFLMPKEPSRWLVGYDHVIDLKVQKGDRVKVGQQIGKPARENSGNLRFEFQINKDNDSTEGTHICPSILVASSVKNTLLGDLRNVLGKWETTTGLELYDVDAQQPVGCLRTEMTPAFASGQ